MNKFLFRIPKALRLFLGLSLGTTSAFAVAPTITSPLADTYTIGAPAEFTYTIVASGVPTSFAAVSLPPFLSHDGNGLISGTPTEDGLFKFTIAASNADGIDIQTFELTVEDVTPVITSASSASGAAGDPFEYDITADNLPDIFDITGLDVFDGLIFDPDAGTIRGTPTAGKTGDVIIEATNSAGTGFAILTIVIASPQDAPPVIISPLAATAVVGQVFNYQIETQLVAPVDPITYAATSLPSGLSHDGNGLISGTPVEDTAVSGPIEITIAASNDAGTDSQVLFLTIVDLVPSISSSSTAIGNEGSSFSYTITADNEPDTFSVTGLEAFDGLSFNPLTGEISGIPTAQLVADVVIRATNSAGTDSEVLTITIGAPLPGTPPVITSALVEETLFGQPYIYTIEATNSPTSYSIGGDPLPQGLSYSGNAITGEPTESGTFYITLSASNAFGESTVETLELTVNPLAPVITSDNFVNGNVGSPFSYQILATGGPVLTYSASLANLPGLTLDPNTGLIFGTPTTEGTVTISVSATNVTGTGTDEIEITIRPALPPSPTPPSVATVNSVTYTTPTVASAGALNGAVLDYFDGDDIDPDGLSRTQEELNQLTVIADVTPAAGETIDTVFVRWNNPPAKPDGTPRAPIILAQLVNTAGNDYQATVDIGFDPENREIGGGSIDLEVVAYQTNALSTDDFASDSSTFRIDPLLEVLFPDDNLTRGFFDVGDIFASARVGTNDFSKVTARISGPGIVFSSEDDDASDNENGLHNFDLPQLINFEGTYQVEVAVEDLSGATTVVRKQLFLSEIIGAPTALIVSPTPGFTNEVFTPAVLQYTETSRAIVTVDEVGVVGVNVSYSLSLVSAGQGYFPRNASGATLLTTGGHNVTRGIAGVTLSNGRVDTLPDEVTIFYNVGNPEWGSFGNAVMDDLRDPGANGKIDISAQFFRALGELKTYRLFVNGADLTPGNGNLDIDDGPIDIPAIEFPPAGQGSPDPGDYVVFAQVFDENGQTATSSPITFQILPYEPLEISLSRQVAAGGDPTDPILIGGSATFLAQVSPVNEIDEVEFFESNSGDSLGFGSRVQLSGNTFFRFSNVFAEAGDFGIFARATGFNGQTVISAPVPISVLSGDFPTVKITSPADGVSVTAGNNLPILIEAGDADGQITAVEVFDGTTSLGTAVPTGLAGEYRLNFTPTVDDLGVLNLTAKATDDRGNQTDSELVVVGVVRGEVPQIEILEPAAGAILSVDQPFTVRARVTDGDGIITSATLTDNNFFFEASQGTISIRPGSQSFFGDVMQKSSEPNEFVFIATIENSDVVDMVLTAADDDGNVVQSETVQFTITAGVVPDATITAPLSGSGPYTRGSVIPVEITASDLDGSVAQVEVFNGATSLGLANLVGANSYRFDYVANTVGLVNLQARATDDRGNVGISNLETISVFTGGIPAVTIDSPSAKSTHNYGDVIPFEITAFDLDGSISSVSVSYLDNGTPSELGQALFIGNDQYRFFLDSATLPTAGTKYISVLAVDDRGNTSTELVEIQLNVVPFSVEFTSPTASPYVIEGAPDEFFGATRSFTVEVGGIDASTLASIDWQLDDGSPAVSQTLDGGLTYSQNFEFSNTGTLTVTATNSEGVSVQSSLTVFVDLPNPSSYTDEGLEDFIYFIYKQVQGLVPSEEELEEATKVIGPLGDDTPVNRAAFADTLFPLDQYSNSESQTVALVYKTLTGLWPTQTQLEAGLEIISQDPEVQSSQTVVSLEGSITAGATQILSFDYTQGDEVVIGVSGDGTNGNPLTDATLTVRAPDGSFVGFSDDSFLGGVFDLDPSVSFVASQTGTYTATVGGYSLSLSGDFIVTSTASSIESDTTTLEARALVEALKGEYNGSNGFLADADTDSFNLAPSFVAQIYRNKHGVSITTLNSGILGQRLTGIDEDMGNGYILPGYQSDVVNFVADFALDVNLATGPIASIPTGDGYPYTKIVYYGRPNNPLSSWDFARKAVQSEANRSFALRALLPAAQGFDVGEAETLEEVLTSIFVSEEFANQFPGDTTLIDTDFDLIPDYIELLLKTDPSDALDIPTEDDSIVAQRMVDLGVVDGSSVTADADADGDGVSNIAEYLLNTDPSDGSVTPTAVDSFVAQRMVDLGILDGDQVAADDDADGDGVSNIAEILLNTDPSDGGEEPTSTGSTTIEGNEFVLEFVRLMPEKTPAGISIVVQSSSDLSPTSWTAVPDLESELEPSADQSGITSDYERLELRIDTTGDNCRFFRLSVQ